jgi:hypothetical protein
MWLLCERDKTSYLLIWAAIWNWHFNGPLLDRQCTGGAGQDLLSPISRLRLTRDDVGVLRIHAKDPLVRDLKTSIYDRLPKLGDTVRLDRRK